MGAISNDILPILVGMDIHETDHRSLGQDSRLGAQAFKGGLCLEWLLNLRLTHHERIASFPVNGVFPSDKR